MNMRRKRKIKQLTICDVFEDDIEHVKNYMILVEYQNGRPKHSYIVDMQGFRYSDQEQPYYVFNDN